MLKHFISLEWKSFFRSASFKVNIALKILMIIGVFFMLIYALGIGIGAYYIIEEMVDPDPLKIINKFFLKPV